MAGADLIRQNTQTQIPPCELGHACQLLQVLKYPIIDPSDVIFS